MGVFISETLLRRYLDSSMARLNEIVENGNVDQQLAAATQLSHLVLSITKMEEDEAILDDRENWQKFEEEDEEEE
jgi:hypothetical protein